ncbi:hypothetical protein FS837_011823 [Tulasnella sp. UAMH 9824]|nr:hypothetical protein FS837_011823 [Tulasnella sp. UAMH 9824]
MTPLSQDALPNAQSPLMDNVRRTDSDGTITAGHLAQAQACEQAATSITSQSKSLAPAFRPDCNIRHHGINQLPTELLVDVFESCLDIDNNEDHFRQDATQLHRICAVCHRWKTVAEGTPRLWCYVSSLDPPQHINKALELSQMLPIAVVYNNLGSRVSEEAFRATVNPHAARWDQAFLNYDDLDKVDPQVWESSNLSKLHSLEVFSDSAEYTRHPILLNCGQGLPNLQVAKFVNIPLRLTPGQLPGLRMLELTGCEDPETGFSIPQLLQILTGTPQLQRLGLFDIEIEADINGVDPDRIKQLLSSIHLPQCEKDQNEAHHQVSEEAPTNPDDVSFDERDIDVLDVQDDQMYSLIGRFKLFASAGSDWSVLEYMGMALDGFAKEIASSEHIHVEINITDRPEAPAITSILIRLDQLPNLRSLELVLSPGTAPLLTLIQLLSRPNVVSDRIFWYLPHLEFLFIRAERPPFLELGKLCWVRRRAAEILKCPKEIRELHISPMDESLEEEFRSQVDYKIEQELDRLQGILGKGQLFWGSEPWTKRVNGDGLESTS